MALDSEERWRSEGVQIGGAGSARGVLGTWFDKVRPARRLPRRGLTVSRRTLSPRGLRGRRRTGRSAIS